MVWYRVPTAKTGKTGKMTCQGKHGEFGNFAKAQGNVRSSSKLPDSKDTGNCDNCRVF